MSTLSKRRVVLEKTPKPNFLLGISFGYIEDDTGQQSHEVYNMKATDWNDMGRPETITLTIEPGDALNER